jgi:HEAT repeat protein
MNLLERAFLAAVFLVAGAVILVALGALGVVQVPFVSDSSPEEAPSGTLDDAYALPPPPPDEPEDGLLAELGGLDGDVPGLPPTPPPEALAGPDAPPGEVEGADTAGDESLASADGAVEAAEDPGKRRDPLIDRLKARTDVKDAGQLWAFLMGASTPRGTKLGEEDVAFLLEALGAQKDYGLRNLVLAHLERIGGEQVTAGVLRFIADEKNPHAVARALETLRRQNDPASIERLVRVLAETESGRLRDVAFKNLLGTRNEGATDSLLSVLHGTRDPKVKSYALAALSQLGGAAGTSAVLAYAGSADGFERSLGLKSLRDIKSPAAVPVLNDALSTQRSPFVRQQVLRTLGRLRDPRSIPQVNHVALYGESRQLRGEAIRTLAVIGRSTAVPTLQSIVQNDQDRSIRRSAQRAITVIERAEERRRLRPRAPRGRR